MRYDTIQDYVRLLKEEDMLSACGLCGKGDILIRNLTYNSKEVTADTMFICKGSAFKPVYLREAVQKGAACYVSEKVYDLPEEIPYILVKDIRRAMPVLANRFYNRPWEELTVVGVGGTMENPLSPII